MPIIRKKLIPDEVYPESIQYDPDTGQVQRKVGDEWVDAPESDPRHQTTFPPRLTANPACDAAQSVADAFKGQIDQILEAIDNGQTAFTIASLILGLFAFGVFDIFIAIALAIGNAMLDAGTAAIEASLTPAAYEDMVCALYCQMDSQGRITADGLGAAQSEITDKVGGVGAVILNAMLSLAGEGGVNNIASLGTSTGDCSSCDCSCISVDVVVGAAAVAASQASNIGTTYRFTCTGTGNYATASDYFCDAFYYTPGDSWATQVADGDHQIHVDGVAISAPAYNGDHIYIFDVAGTDDPFTLQMPDEDPGNDSGSIHVEICAL